MEVDSLERVKGVSLTVARSRKERMKVSKGMTSKREQDTRRRDAEWEEGEKVDEKRMYRHTLGRGEGLCGRGKCARAHR